MTVLLALVAAIAAPPALLGLLGALLGDGSGVTEASFDA